jgi:hypothetical protein
MRLSLLLSTVVLPVTLLATPQPVTNPLVDIEARQGHGSPGNPCAFCDNYYYKCLDVSILKH